MKFSVLANVLFCAHIAHAAPQSRDFIVDGCIMRASAYVDHNSRSRYSLEILQTPRGARRWGFTLSDAPNRMQDTKVSGAISRVPYSGKKETTIRGTLHEYAVFDERVTFKNVKLGPLLEKTPGMMNISPRYLEIPQALTATTRSGVRVTLPAQGFDTLRQVLINVNGNLNALFVQIRVTPNERVVKLPQSPLYQQFRKPLRLTLDVSKPNQLLSSGANNASTLIAIGLPDLKTATRFDEFTLIVRQRVNLRSIPLALAVPISR
jgi:hypothetical protein